MVQELGWMFSNGPFKIQNNVLLLNVDIYKDEDSINDHVELGQHVMSPN